MKAVKNKIRFVSNSGQAGASGDGGEVVKMWKALAGILAAIGIVVGIMGEGDKAHERERVLLRKLSDACGDYAAVLGGNNADDEWGKTYKRVRDAVYEIPGLESSYPKLQK